MQSVLATNQGVVGSIPASRTKLNKGLHRKTQTLFLLAFSKHRQLL